MNLLNTVKILFYITLHAAKLELVGEQKQIN